MILHVSKNSELSLRKKDSPFSRDLWKGVGLAFALHLALFLIFRVASLSDVNEPPMLLPAAVEIDLGHPLTASSEIRHSTAVTPPIELFSPPRPLDLPISNLLIEPSYQRALLTPDFYDLEWFDDEFMEEFKEEK